LTFTSAGVGWRWNSAIVSLMKAAGGIAFGSSAWPGNQVRLHGRRNQFEDFDFRFLLQMPQGHRVGMHSRLRGPVSSARFTLKQMIGADVAVRAAPVGTVAVRKTGDE
jgi:hypothetical protein